MKKETKIPKEPKTPKIPKIKEIKEPKPAQANEPEATPEAKLSPADHVAAIKKEYLSIQEGCTHRELNMAIDGVLKALNSVESCAKNVDQVLSVIDQQKVKAEKTKSKE